jgi:methyl-accepting chemotaxis protein
MTLYLPQLLRRSLRAKLIGIFLLFLICIVTFELIYFPGQQKAQSLEMVNTQTGTLCDMLAFSVGAGLKDANFELVQTAFDWAKRDSNVIFISILDESKSSIVEHNPRQLNIDKSSLLSQNGIIDGDSYITVISPIKYQNKNYGVIIIAYSLDEIHSRINTQLWTSFIIGLLMFGLGSLAIAIVAKYIVQGFTDLVNAMEKFAEGDLRVRVNSDREDEVGQLSKGFNLSLEKVNNMMLGVSEGVEKTNEASSQISVSTEQLAAGAQEQSSQASEVASAVEEMTKTIVENSKNATIASETAKKSREAAEAGGIVVKETITGMQRIAEVVNVSARTVEALGKSSDQIGQIISVIDDIADQTNLLALNAAIEAARAGEHGRGFAVVADEVRKLAERTTKATKEIADMIKQIQLETGGAVSSMKEGTRQVAEGIQLADRAGASLQEIVGISQQVTDMVTQIAAASEEQSSASEQIAKNIEAINSVTNESASGTQQIARAAEDLNRLTEDLQLLISRFQLSERDETTRKNKHQLTARRAREEKSRTAVRENGALVPHK